MNIGAYEWHHKCVCFIAVAIVTTCIVPLHGELPHLVEWQVWFVLLLFPTTKKYLRVLKKMITAGAGQHQDVYFMFYNQLCHFSFAHAWKVHVTKSTQFRVHVRKCVKFLCSKSCSKSTMNASRTIPPFYDVRHMYVYFMFYDETTYCYSFDAWLVWWLFCEGCKFAPMMIRLQQTQSKSDCTSDCWVW